MAQTEQKTAKKNCRPLSRVTIAQDVLKMLDAKKLEASSGNYFYSTGLNHVAGNLGLKEALQKPEVTCRVCALGALFVAKIDRRNTLSVSRGYRMPPDEMRGWLGDIFSEVELLLIEDAFEGFGQTAGLVTPDVLAAARKFRSRIGDDEQRMRAIMKNIIKHKTFRPELEVWS